LKSRRGCRRSGRHLRHQHTWTVETPPGLDGVDGVEVADAKKRMLHLLMRDELAGDLLREVRRNAVPDVGGAARNGDVDSDNASLDVGERAAAVAGIDRGIGLQHVLERLARGGVLTACGD